jgi:hypothetical protein
MKIGKPVSDVAKDIESRLLGCVCDGNEEFN